MYLFEQAVAEIEQAQISIGQAVLEIEQPLIYILRSVQEKLRKLPNYVYQRIRDRIRILATQPRPLGYLSLSRWGELHIRIGNYRLIYEIEDGLGIITIFHIGYRH
jgi:mRNA interferase RelE/StbE